ncbi:hypothetical protein ACP4OV_009191 [Aristida adscensionis]
MTGPDEHGAVHVLLVAYPAQGHINPLLQFGKLLARRRGVRCTLAVTRSALASGARPPARPGAVRVAAFSDGCDRLGYAEAGGERAYLARLESAGSRTLGELLAAESAAGRPVRAVVYDALLPWAPRVARRHGASCAVFFTQACAVNVAYAHAWAGAVALPVDGASPAPEMPGLRKGLGLQPADLPTFLTEPAGGGGSSGYLDLVLQQCHGLEMADHVLVNSFHELQTEEAEYMASRWGAKTIGPTLPSACLDNRDLDDASYGFNLHAPMTTECKAWLDEKAPRSVVFVSFGSLVTLSQDQVAEVAEGLYNSGKAFLWVVRASETWKIPASFVEKAKETGLVVTWSPQFEVLAHGAIGCFMTHCGWNSVIEGLGIGVPMVAMPQWADQPMNAKYVEDVWRVGIRVNANMEGVVTKEEVERCVLEVMEGEMSKEFKKNATSWSEKAKIAIREGGSSDKNIMDFVTKLQLN